MRQFQYVSTTYFSENKESYFEVYTYQVSCQLSLLLFFKKKKHLKLPIIIKIPVTLPQIVCICMAAISLNSISITNYLLEGNTHLCKGVTTVCNSVHCTHKKAMNKT